MEAITCELAYHFKPELALDSCYSFIMETCWGNSVYPFFPYGLPNDETHVVKYLILHL